MTIIEKQDKFIELLDSINDRLYMYSRSLENCREDAEDLVNDTIMACYENFENLKDYSCFKGYVFKTARSKFRQKHRRSWLFGKNDSLNANNMISNDFKPDLPLEIEILYKTLDKLPDKQKEAVVLFEISGFSLEEIKDIQNSTLSAVKSRVKRGREKLTELLVHRDNFYKNERVKIINLPIKQD
jgi:RNA polymerase sigma-70 factor (ECF subfamily)